MMALALLLSLQTDSSGLRWSEVDGQYLISADIVGADPRKLFGEIATRSGRKLVGIEHLPATLPITLAFTDRPLSWVTQAVAGSVGWHVQLRSDRIELSVDDLSRLSESELENRLQAACLRALRNDGQNADAPRAELALGTIEERRGNVQAALGHFQSAVERDPDGELAPQALMHAGAAHIRLSQHVQAIECFTRVVGHAHTGAEQAEARLQLTRAIALNGDGRQALFLLDSLDQQSPAANDDERQTREYVRALACLKAERRAEALEALARAENTGASPEWARTAHELRAEVLAHFGRNRDAALAWLAAGKTSTGEAQAQAWIKAADQSLLAGDAVGVLMIQGLAKDSTAATALAPMAELARKRLGLSKHSDGAAGDLLEIAWRAMERGQPSKALAALEQAYPLREQREPEARLDLVLLYARALGANQQVDRALDVLRLEGSGVTDAAVLGRLCFMAGSLLEAAGRHEEAFAAFGGKL
jgi:tetratricopeptide (TPR) repeat protein